MKSENKSRTSYNVANWSDKPVFLFGNGASLNTINFDRLSNADIYRVGIEHTMFNDVCAVVCTDPQFIEKHQESLQTLHDDGVELFLAPDVDVPAPVPLIRRVTRPGLSNSPVVLHAVSSGYAALNVAYLKRARLIVLCGYDDGDYNSTLMQLRKTRTVVLNANSNSAITAFPTITAQEACRIAQRHYVGFRRLMRHG